MDILYKKKLVNTFQCLYCHWLTGSVSKSTLQMTLVHYSKFTYTGACAHKVSEQGMMLYEDELIVQQNYTHSYLVLWSCLNPDLLMLS